jgi:WD40 repeat protein
MALSADGHTAVSVGCDNAVRVWDLTTGPCLRILKGRSKRHTGPADSVALSSDGRTAISGGADKVVRVWDVASGRCLRILEVHADWAESVALSVALSADGRIAISGARDPRGRFIEYQTVQVWDVVTGRCLRTLEGHTGAVNAVALSADSRIAVSGGRDNTVRVWDVASGRCLRTCGPHFDVESVALSADGRTAVFGCRSVLKLGWGVEVWNCGTALPVVAGPYELSAPATSATALEDAAAYRGGLEDARRALAAGDYRTAAGHLRRARAVPGYRRRKEVVELWSGLYTRLRRSALAGGWVKFRLLVTVCGHSNSRNSVAVSGDGRTAISNSGEEVRIWDLVTGRCRRTLEGHTGRVQSLSLSADGRTAVSLQFDGTARLWDVVTGRCRRTLGGHRGPVESVALSANGRTAVTGGSDNTIRVWDVATGRCRRTIKSRTTQGVWLVAVSGDGGVAVSQGSRYKLGKWQDKPVRVWNLVSGRCLRTLEKDTAIDVAISSDGRTAVLSGLERDVQVWDLTRVRCLRLRSLKGMAGPAALSADGRTAVSCGNNDILVWDVATGYCLRTLEGHTEYVSSVALSADGSTAVSGSSDDGTVRVWTLDWELEECPPTIKDRFLAGLKNRFFGGG